MDKKYYIGFRKYCDVVQRLNSHSAKIIQIQSKINPDNYVDMFSDISLLIKDYASDVFTIFSFNVKTEELTKNSGIILLKENSKIMESLFKKFPTMFNEFSYRLRLENYKEHLQNPSIIDENLVENSTKPIIDEIVKNQLKNIRKLRNKLEHEPHNVYLHFQQGNTKDCQLIFKYTKNVEQIDYYNIDTRFIMKLTTIINEIFNKLIDEINDYLKDKTGMERYKEYCSELKFANI